MDILQVGVCKKTKGTIHQINNNTTATIWGINYGVIALLDQLVMKPWITINFHIIIQYQWSALY